MKYQKSISTASAIYVGFSLLALASVSILSMFNPQATMDLVKVKLANTDALSSIRGVYGGVGLSLVISLIYVTKHQFRWVLGFLTIFWGFYAISRVVTLLMDGPLGDFGNQWLFIESALFFLGLGLNILQKVTAHDMGWTF